jgi:hypothetical protein
MTRSGQDLIDAACDDLKGKFDPNATYTTNSLIDLMRNDPDFTLIHCVSWFFGVSDWHNSNDQTTINYAYSKLNTFIQNNPSPTGMQMTIDSNTTLEDFLEFYAPMTETEQEQLKQDILDVFYT